MGTVESKLKYQEYIGGGASGQVFRATWRSRSYGKGTVAAKKIPFQGAIPDQVKREVEYLKKLEHRNIIKYYNTLIEEHHVVIVTKYAAKGSLYHYLKDQNKLPEKLLHIWMFHLISGIDYLRQSRIGHRDLKSPNCVITADDVLKICDFGIARDLTSTTTTYVKGSFRWLAPEAIKDKTLSPKSEIFAFAIIVWEMVMCEEPYKGLKTEYVIYNVCNTGLRPQIPNDCPPFLKELMEKCWHVDLEMRPTSEETAQMICKEYKDDLRGQESLVNFLTETDGLEWKLKHQIKSDGALKFVANDRLAICKNNGVEVYQVTRAESSLRHKLTHDDWGDRVYPIGVAMSESTSDSGSSTDVLLIICWNSAHVYQLPHQCRKSLRCTDVVKRYLIHDGHKIQPRCITANADTAVIGLRRRDALVVCGLPGFIIQRIVNTSFFPYDLCIASDYLVLMGLENIVMRSLGNLDEDVCRIQPPDGLIGKGVSYRNDERQLYVASYDTHNTKGVVYRYTWNGNGTPQYVNTGRVIDDLYGVWPTGFSISTDGLLTVSVSTDITRVFSLE